MQLRWLLIGLSLALPFSLIAQNHLADIPTAQGTQIWAQGAEQTQADSLPTEPARLWVHNGILYPPDHPSRQDSLFLSNLLKGLNLVHIEYLDGKEGKARYGKAGENGVMVLTVYEEAIRYVPEIHFNAHTSLSWVGRRPEMMGMNDYAQYQNEIAALKGQSNVFQIDNLPTEINPQSVLFRPAYAQQYNIALNGGGKHISNRYASISFKDEVGTVDNSGSQQLRGKLRLEKYSEKGKYGINAYGEQLRQYGYFCLLYTSPSPRDA